MLFITQMHIGILVTDIAHDFCHILIGLAMELQIAKRADAAAIYNSVELAGVLNKIPLVDVLVYLYDLAVAYRAAFFLAEDVLFTKTDIVAHHGAAAGEIGQEYLQLTGGFRLLNVGLELSGG